MHLPRTPASASAENEEKLYYYTTRIARQGQYRNWYIDRANELLFTQGIRDTVETLLKNRFQLLPNANPKVYDSRYDALRYQDAQGRETALVLYYAEDSPQMDLTVMDAYCPWRKDEKPSVAELLRKNEGYIAQMLFTCTELFLCGREASRYQLVVVEPSVLRKRRSIAGARTVSEYVTLSIAKAARPMHQRKADAIKRNGITVFSLRDFLATCFSEKTAAQLLTRLEGIVETFSERFTAALP